MVSPVTAPTTTSVISTPPGDERISRIVARNLRAEKSEAGKVATPRRYADLSQHRSSTPFEELSQTEAETILTPISENSTRTLLKRCHPEIAAGLTRALNAELDRWVLLKLRELTSLDTPIDFETFVAHLLRRPDERETALLFLSRWFHRTNNPDLLYLSKGFGLSSKERLSLYDSESRTHRYMPSFRRARTFPTDARSIYFLDYAKLRPSSYLKKLRSLTCPPLDLDIICIRIILNNPEFKLDDEDFLFLSPLAQKHRFEGLLVKKAAESIVSKIDKPSSLNKQVKSLQMLYAFAKNTTPPTTTELQTFFLARLQATMLSAEQAFRATLLCGLIHIPLDQRRLFTNLVPAQITVHLEKVFTNVKNPTQIRQCIELFKISADGLYKERNNEEMLSIFITKIVPNLAKTRDREIFRELKESLECLVTKNSFPTLNLAITINNQLKIALSRFMLLLIPNIYETNNLTTQILCVEKILGLQSRLNSYNNLLRNDENPFTLNMLRLFTQSEVFFGAASLLERILADREHVQQSIRLMTFVSGFTYAWIGWRNDKIPEIPQLGHESTVADVAQWRDTIWEIEYGLSRSLVPDLFEKMAVYFDTPRMLGMLEAYEAGRDPQVRPYFTQFITDVINGTFLDRRYHPSTSTHLAQLASIDAGALLDKWRTPLLHRLEANLVVTDTDHYEDLYLMGTEVSESCQTVFGRTEYNRALMGYVHAGQVKVLAVKAATTGKIVTRAVCRLLFDCKTQAPCLFVERPYGVKSAANLQAIVEHALRKAEQLGNIPVYSQSFPMQSKTVNPSITIESKGSPVPFNYVDADGLRITNGTFKLSRLQLLS